MPTVTLPVIGTVERKWVAIGGAAVAGIVGYAYWRHRSAASSAASSTTDPNAIDPLTGLPYSAESSGGTGYVNPVPNADGSSTVDTTTTTAITTNTQWAQAVTEALGGLYDATFLAQTLGKYLSDQPLTADEAVVIRAAWALVGHPPAPDHNIKLTTGTPAPGGGGGGGGGGGSTTHVATRNNNVPNILKSTTIHSWNDLARWAYWWSGHTDAGNQKLNGLFGSLLAHANGQGGLSDPSKIKNIHMPDTLAGTI